MKQTSYLIEIVINQSEDGSVRESDAASTIIVRDGRGSIVKICSSPDEVTSFLLKCVKALKTVNPQPGSFAHE